MELLEVVSRVPAYLIDCLQGRLRQLAEPLVKLAEETGRIDEVVGILRVFKRKRLSLVERTLELQVDLSESHASQEEEGEEIDLDSEEDSAQDQSPEDGSIEVIEL